MKKLHYRSSLEVVVFVIQNIYFFVLCSDFFMSRLLEEKDLRNQEKEESGSPSEPEVPPPSPRSAQTKNKKSVDKGRATSLLHVRYQYYTYFTHCVFGILALFNGENKYYIPFSIIISAWLTLITVLYFVLLQCILLCSLSVIFIMLMMLLIWMIMPLSCRYVMSTHLVAICNLQARCH